MTKEVQEQLLKIKKVAEKILKEHKNSTEKFSGVNYGDLSVEDVSYIVSLNNEDYYEVLIEECSPTAYEFQEFMLESFKEKLDFFVSVRTEW